MPDTRRSFQEQLHELQEDVVRMGGLAAEAVRLAVASLDTRTLELVDQVQKIENQIDALNLSIESKCLHLLALQQPMAKDLRTIAAALRMITDIERIGDYAVDISHQARTMSDRPLFKPLVDIPRMAGIVQRMLHDSLRAFVTRDLALASAAVQLDDEVDHIYHALHEELEAFIQRDPSVTFQAVRLIMVGAYLERMADHITNIGERIFFMETGELKELHQ
jgi:phosphate transport system protein